MNAKKQIKNEIKNMLYMDIASTRIIEHKVVEIGKPFKLDGKTYVIQEVKP
jgi:hypothetical protein